MMENVLILSSGIAFLYGLVALWVWLQDRKGNKTTTTKI